MRVLVRESECGSELGSISVGVQGRTCLGCAGQRSNVDRDISREILCGERV